MRLSLERLDARAVDLDLPGPGGQQVRAREIVGLRGALAQLERDARGAEGPKSADASGAPPPSDLSAERIVLDALRVLLGELVLTAGESSTLDDVRVSGDVLGEPLSLELVAGVVDAPALGIAVDTVDLRGKTTIAQLRVSVRGIEGSLESARLDVTGLEVRIGDLQAQVERLVATGLVVAWGAGPLRLSAGSLEARGVQLASPLMRLEASHATVEALAIDGSSVSLGKASVESGGFGVTFGGESPNGAAQRPGSAPPAGLEGAGGESTAAAPIVDLRVLDTLVGQLDVDLTVEIDIPILGHRTSTHPFRIPIEGGALDYRRLESNLSTLEDSILDFSVRDGTLVLERGIPLLPTRGRGKPLVTWPLDEEDVALAKANRVRLSVLAAPRVVQDGSSDDAAGATATAPATAAATAAAAAKDSPLRRLELRRINARVALGDQPRAPGGQLQLRQLASLTLRGDVFHDAGGGTRDGKVAGDLAGLELGAAALDLGGARVDVARLGVARVTALEVAFAGVDPRSVRATFEGLSIDGAKSTP